MKFDDHVNGLIDNIEIPDELQPDNIARMLKIKTAEKNKKPIDIKSQKKAIILRTVSAVAACSVLALGVTAMLNTETSGIPAGYIESAGQIKTAEDYSVVYKAFQNSVINNGGEIDNKRNVIEITPDGTDKPQGENEPHKQTAVTENGNVTEYKITGNCRKDDTADIVQSDAENIYYIANSALYSIKKGNGNIEVISKEHKADSKPVEMYTDGDRLIVISSVTDEIPYEIHANSGTETTTKSDAEAKSVTVDDNSADSTEATETINAETTVARLNSENLPAVVEQNNTIVEIFDKTTLKKINVFKQNGSYISSGISDGNLYMVTNYSDFQSKPLEKENDLDNYVPSYSLNGEKLYVEAKDILIPNTADATGYTITSALNIHTDNPLVSVKAVVGSGNHAVAYDNDIYVIGSTCSEKNVTATSIVKFVLENGNLIYKSSIAVEGVVASPYSMNKYNDTFRIATKVSDKKAKNSYININVLDDSLNVIGTLTNASENKEFTGVKFFENTAFVTLKNNEKPIEIDLTNPGAPKVSGQESLSSKIAYLNKFGDKYLGISTFDYENNNTDITKVTLFDSNLQELSTAEIKGAVSSLNSADDILNKHKLYIDAENGIIGIPTIQKVDYGIKNSYSIYTVTDKLEKKCALDYSEINELNAFNRAVIDNNILYVLSNSRIVSYNLDEQKVIDTILIK